MNLNEWTASNVPQEACPLLCVFFFFNKCKSIIRHTNGERVYDFFFYARGCLNKYDEKNVVKGNCSCIKFPLSDFRELLA